MEELQYKCHNFARNIYIAWKEMLYANSIKNEVVHISSRNIRCVSKCSQNTHTAILIKSKSENVEGRCNQRQRRVVILALYEDRVTKAFIAACGNRYRSAVRRVISKTGKREGKEGWDWSQKFIRELSDFYSIQIVLCNTHPSSCGWRGIIMAELWWWKFFLIS